MAIRKFFCPVIFVLISFPAWAQVISNFSTSSDGWSVLFVGSPDVVAYNSASGNPPGDITYTIPSGPTSGTTNAYWVAPAKFLGNVSRAYNQNLTFDMLQSVAGSDNTNNDIVILSGTTTLVYQLPSKPGTSWTSYSISLNENQWHNGCGTCSAPNQILMKQVLSNITGFQIRLKYSSATTYTAQLDNVVINETSLGAPPSITSFSPASGLAGSTVTISGSNFNANATSNAVYFNGTKATVSNATSTHLTVVVPNSASYGSITVEDISTQLQARSTQKFNPLFNNNNDFGGRIIQSSMSRGNVNLLQTGTESYNSFGGIDKGDLDGDGWIDMIVTETSVPKIMVYRNLGTGGSASASTFSSPFTLAGLSTVPGGGPGLSQVMVVDVDNDGKLDVAASTSGNLSFGTSFLAIFLNTSTPGNLSFANPAFFAYPYYAALAMAAGDLDGDGRIDFAFTTGSAPGGIWAVQNQSSPGSVDFAYGISIGSTSSHSDLSITDLNADSKPELIASTGGSIEIYQNNSTAGTINLSAPFSISVSSGSYIAVADLDADNKSDLIWSAYGAGFIYYSQNIFNGASFTASSFGAPVAISNQLANPDGLTISDINGDAKPDIVITGSSDLGIMQNVGAAGALGSSSFTSPVIFQGSASGSYIYGTRPIAADFDGDNKPEAAFVYANNAVPAPEKGVYLFHNQSFQPPQITSISPSTAPSGNVITVNGKYLNTENGNPQVSGIGIISSASNVSNTSLQINAPTGSADNRISATLHGLEAFSPTQFYTQLNGGLGGAINSSTFGASVDFNLSSFVANPGLTVADFDRDGKPDIIVDDNGTGKIYANTTSSAGATISASSFTKPVNTLSSAGHLRATDLDGDGVTDIAANNFLFAGQGLFPNPISFSAYSYSPAGNTNWILTNHDFNYDGKPEVVVSNTSNQIQVYENFTNTGSPFIYSGALASLSNSPLTYSNAGGVVGVTAADFDGDGFEDIAYGVSSATSTLNVLLNSGSKQMMTSSQFAGPTTFAALSSPQYISTADFDGDGNLDLALGYYSTGLFISVYLNTSTVGNLSFTRQDFAAPAYCNDLQVADIDGDGKPEIVTINNPSGSNGSFSVFRNISSVGTISFSPAVTFSLGTTVPKILSLADVNLDNKTDIIISRTGPASATLSIFQNLISFPTISISPQPTSVYSVCDGASPTITTGASGTTNIGYQWQIFNAAAGSYSDITNTGGYSNVSTASLTINSTGNFGNGTYRCKITGDFAIPSYSNTVSFTVNAIPSAPTASNVNNCGPGSVILTANGGSTGNYIWYDPTNTVISGQVNSTLTTPVLSSSTNYSVAITNGSCTSTQTSVAVTINPVPTPPTSSNVSQCGPGSIILTANGGSNGNYIWYDPTNTVISGQINSTLTTPVLSSSTNYSVAITNGSCTSAQTSVAVTINPVPSAPSAPSAMGCPNSAVTLTASGGSNGNYIWYDQDQTAVAGQTNSSYTTPLLPSNTNFYVAITNGTCVSTMTLITVSISSSGCSAPVITAQPLATQIGGTITLDLVPLISTPGSSLDLTSLQITTPPSSGASATISAAGVLSIDYTGINFSGTETISIRACDTNGNCSTQQFSIDVAGNIVVYNGISPNGKNPILTIEYIDLLPDTKSNTVYIFDRWENLVWHGNNYDNTSVVFSGNSDSGASLPSGVYFYKIQFASGRKTETGFISLRRQ